MFCYNDYKNLLTVCKDNGYKMFPLVKYKNNVKEIIIRHDIDLSLEKATRIAEIENSMNISASYFIMLTSSFYNLFEKKNKDYISYLIGLGHEIGLHYDETVYGKHLTDAELKKTIFNEVRIFENSFGIEIKSISMHIPDKRLFGYKLDLTQGKRTLYNAYDPSFTTTIKYLSDSMMVWREPVIDIIKSQKFANLQILTHPIWYTDNYIGEASDVLKMELEKRQKELYGYMQLIKPNFPN